MVIEILSRNGMYIKRNLQISLGRVVSAIAQRPNLGGLRHQVRAWYDFRRDRLARAAEVERFDVDADLFVKWMLDPGNVAKRPSPHHGHQEFPMQGRHVSLGPMVKHLRGSDLSERVYVCVEVLERKGFTNKEACLKVAEALEWKWKSARTRRGRPRGQKTAPDFYDKAQIVRSLANKYRHTWKGNTPDPVVCNYISAFLHFQDWAAYTREIAKTPAVKAAYEEILGLDYVARFVLSPTG